MDKQRYKITTGEHISTYQLMGIPKILAPSYQVAVYLIQLALYCRTGGHVIKHDTRNEI